MVTAFASWASGRVLVRAPPRPACASSTSPRIFACASPPPPANGVPPKAEESADQQYITSAISSGGTIREELERSAQERKDNAAAVQQSIADMNEALDSILSKLRGDTGVAPVKKKTVVKDPSEPKMPDPVPEVDDSYLDSDAEPYMDPNLFGMDSTAGWQVLANSENLPSSGAPVKFRIECDGSGCSIIEMDADAAPGPGVRQKFVSSGKGYRVGYDPEAPDSFCGMAGNEHWLLAMDKRETQHFKRLVTGVARKMARIERGDEQAPAERETPAVRRSGDGMFNERVVATTGAGCSVEMESKLMWVQAVGKPRLGGYALRVIFMERRQSEAYWAADVLPNMLVAVAKLAVE